MWNILYDSVLRLEHPGVRTSISNNGELAVMVADEYLSLFSENPNICLEPLDGRKGARTGSKTEVVNPEGNRAKCYMFKNVST